MHKSYTLSNYKTPIDFNPDATDEEIMRIANMAAESKYKADNTIISNILQYASSFEFIGNSNSSQKIFLN